MSLFAKIILFLLGLYFLATYFNIVLVILLAIGIYKVIKKAYTYKVNKAKLDNYKEELEKYFNNDNVSTEIIKAAPISHEDFKVITEKYCNIIYDTTIFAKNRNKYEMINYYIDSLKETKRNCDTLKIYNNKLPLYHEFDELIKKCEKMSADYRATNLGLIGEKKVRQEIEKNFINGNPKVFDNISLEFEINNKKNIAQHDFIIVSNHGVFDIEVKNFSRTTSKKTSLLFKKDGVLEKYNGEKKVETDNQILKQISWHQNSLSTIFSKYNIINPPIYQVIVIANEKIEIDNENELIDVMRKEMLPMFINKKEVLIDMNMQKDIIEALNKSTVENKIHEKIIFDDSQETTKRINNFYKTHFIMRDLCDFYKSQKNKI